MKKIIGLVLIIGGLALAGLGFSKRADSSGGVSIGSLEISATDQDSANTAYMMIGVGVIAVIGGAIVVGKK